MTDIIIVAANGKPVSKMLTAACGKQILTCGKNYSSGKHGDLRYMAGLGLACG